MSDPGDAVFGLKEDQGKLPGAPARRPRTRLTGLGYPLDEQSGLEGFGLLTPFTPLLPRLAKRAKIEKRVHAHGLRHTFAYEMASEGHPIHVIQQALGHANAAIMSLYINYLAPCDVVNAMRNREWAA